MPKVKIPRKSTNIDMTAMCDVAFLLLSFFILATKTKPPEAIPVTTPTSVSTKVVKDEAIVVTLGKDGKVFLMLSDRKHKNAIIDDINTTKSLGLTAAEISKLKKQEFIGMPFNKLPTRARSRSTSRDPRRCPHSRTGSRGKSDGRIRSAARSRSIGRCRA